MEDTNTTTDHPATDAPNVAAPTAKTAVLVAGTVAASPADFAAAIKCVTVAASTDQAREVLTGVMIERHRDHGLERTDGDQSADDIITLTATDSYRLHTVDVTVGRDFAELFAEPALLPAKQLAAAAKLLAGRNVTAATVTVADATSAERYAASVAELDQATTAAAVESVTRRYMSRADDRRTVTVAVDGATVTIPAITGDYPNWRNLMPTDDNACGMVTGQPFGFNPKFLADVCKGLGFVATDCAPMRVLGSVGGSPLKPSVFTARRDNVDARALLMPVRLSS